MRRRPKIVVIGGGTGTYVVLTGLRKYPLVLTAIVSMMDSGGSSGRLRDEFGILPPGDVRRALLALSELPLEKISLRQLLEYRFENGEGLKGHTLGNLLLAALDKMTGRTDLAIAEASRMLDVKGKVLPITLTHTHLCARLEDGTIIKGETNIDIRRVRPALKILDVFLDEPATIFAGAKKAIMGADLIVLPPGDLYTSLLPNLLVDGVNRAIYRSGAKLLYVCPLMTKHGETDGFAASDFIKEVQRYLGPAARKFNRALVNTRIRLPRDVLWRYRQEKAQVVKIDEENCQRCGVAIVKKDLAIASQLYRHDSAKLAKAIIANL